MPSSPTSLPPSPVPRVAIVGAGPAGLMAAEVLAAAGASVDLFDAMPSVGRKFLLAGKGGLNLTHAEAIDAFVGRYGARAEVVGTWLQAWSPQNVRDWADGLGAATFVGSSGKVFPHEMKAAPLLRAWLQRLRRAGVRFHMRHRWLPGSLALPARGPLPLRFATASGEVEFQADGLLLALGGASWSRLGSDGRWVPALAAAGIPVAPLQPANCGFDVGWSAYLAAHHAGAPLKNVVLRCDGPAGQRFERKGECVLTATGLEGNLVYAASACLRDRIQREGQATLTLDLRPDRSLDELQQALARGRGARSLANHLREHAGIKGAAAALLREGVSAEDWTQLSKVVAWLAGRIKALPITVTAARPLDEAISTAGGVRLEALDAGLCLRQAPRVALAGEMLDWEAPTGGYLLTACLASGVVAARGLLAALREAASAPLSAP